MDVKIELVKQESRLKAELAIANDQIRTKTKIEAELRRQVELLETKAAEGEGKGWMDYLFY